MSDVSRSGPSPCRQSTAGRHGERGQAAQRRSAVTEARAHFNKGLETVADMLDGQAKIDMEIDFNLALAAVLRAMNGPGHPDVASAYAQAYEVCRDEGESNRSFAVLHGLYLVDNTTGNLDRALMQAEALLKHAGDRPDRLVVAHHTLAEMHYRMGDSRTALDHIDRVFEYYDPKEHAALSYIYGRDFGVYAAGHKAWALYKLGYPDAALTVSPRRPGRLAPCDRGPFGHDGLRRYRRRSKSREGHFRHAHATPQRCVTLTSRS